LCGAAWFC